VIDIAQLEKQLVGNKKTRRVYYHAERESVATPGHVDSRHRDRSSAGKSYHYRDSRHAGRARQVQVQRIKLPCCKRRLVTVAQNQVYPRRQYSAEKSVIMR